MSKTVKIVLAGLAILLVVAGAAWKMAAPRVLAGVQGLLLSQVNSSINGRIEIGTIDFSAFGAAVIKDVKLYDAGNARIAAGEEIRVSYRWADLIGGKFGLDSVKSVSLEKPQLVLGIDKSGKWSLQDIVKPQTDRAAAFHGVVTFKDASVSVTTPGWKRDFTSISGDLDYADPVAVAVDLKGKLKQSTISAKGTWQPEQKTELAIRIDQLELGEAQALLPAPSGTPKLSTGTLKEIQGTVTREPAGVRMTGDAALTGLAVDVQGMALKDGSAKLKLQGDMLTLSDAVVTVDGNRLSVAGSINLAPVSPALALQISSPGVDLAAVAGQKASLAGKAAVQAEVGGTLDKPAVRGSFRINGGQFDTYALTDAEGSFSYAGGVLTLESAGARALGGSIGLSGTMQPAVSRYDLKVTGQNVDGAVLTNKGLSGKMDFTATVSGQGTADSMSASGVFSVPAGTVSDYAITNASGNFHKQGNRVDLSNVGVTLSGQRLSVSGAISLAAGGASPQINLNISSTGLNSTVFNPNSALKGMIAFQATVSGTPEKNQARGNFQIASGALGQLSFAGASGGFGYADGVLTLTGGRAQCLGGTITLNGTVVPKTMEYRQQVNGQNIDAGQLTDHDVQGRADFSANIGGVGDWDKSNADGTFKMNSGSVKGISFNSLTGNFTKRGRQTEFTGMKFNTLGGLASGTGETEGEYIHLVITPNSTANAVVNVLTGKTLQTQDLRVRFRGPNG